MLTCPSSIIQSWQHLLEGCGAMKTCYLGCQWVSQHPRCSVSSGILHLPQVFHSLLTFLPNIDHFFSTAAADCSFLPPLMLSWWFTYTFIPRSLCGFIVDVPAKPLLANSPGKIFSFKPCCTTSMQFATLYQNIFLSNVLSQGTVGLTK